MELWENRPSWLNLSATDDEQKWASAVEQLLSDDSLRQQVRDSSFQAFSCHNWDIAANEYEKIFKQYLK